MTKYHIGQGIAGLLVLVGLFLSDATHASYSVIAFGFLGLFLMLLFIGLDLEAIVKKLK